MKIYIVTDLEGVAGVISKEQTFSNQPDYPKACEWLTQEVNAAVAGAIEGGATDILVIDGHGARGGRNFVYEELIPGARYIQGTPWSEYLQELDSSYDALFHIGAHAMSGTPGAVLEHTMSSEGWVEMTINGKPMGEIGLCAAIAGEYDVPFVMVSGDDKACAEAAEISPGIECAVVKYGISRTSAILLSIETARTLIQQKAKASLSKAKKIKPFKIQPPIEIRITYFRTDMVERIKERDGVRKVGPLTVAYTGNSVKEAFNRVLGG